MNGWLIAAIVLAALLLLILLTPLGVSFRYDPDDGLVFRLRVWGLALAPRQKRAQEDAPVKAPAKPVKKKSRGAVRERIRQEGLVEVLQQFAALFQAFMRRFRKLLSHLRVTRFGLHITVGCDDAALTAVYYGGVCGVVYPLLAQLNALTPLPKNDWRIECDFDAVRAELCVEIGMRLCVFWAIPLAVWALVQVIKWRKKENSHG